MTVLRPAKTTCLFILTLVPHVLAAPARATEPPLKNPAAVVADRGVNVERRAPWIGSKITGSPDPPAPYSVELAFPGLKFESPVLMASARGTERLFIGELKGRLYSFPNDAGCDKVDLAIDLTKVHTDVTAFYGLVFHPRFDTNRQVFVCYVRQNDVPDGSVVSRFTVSRTEPPVVDPKSERVLLNFRSGGHNGGCLEFGNDGFLYISTGDAASPSPPDSLMTGQDCSDLLSSILRIDVDHPEPGKTYRVPPDNPFVTTPGVRPEIWAFGFRNPWKMSFDRATGDLWVGDVGWELWEMVYNVKRGGNYGWSVVEGPQPVNVEARRGPTPILPPVAVHPHSEATSVTGGFVYRGKRLPDLAGAYIYGDFMTGVLWGIRVKDDKVTWQRVLARTPLHLVSFGEAHDGELYLLDYDRTHQIYRLVPNPAATTRSDFPRRLSQTGLFQSTRDHRPATGVVPYVVNAALWSDGAIAERFLAIPSDGQIGVDSQGSWRFPDGSVLVRTVSIEQQPGKPASRRRIETQLLHLQAETWRPYSYVWNSDQNDADLAGPAGTTQTISQLTPDGRHDVNYRVHARTECVLCHNPWVEKKGLAFGIQSASPLGINTPQLNRPSDASAASPNQLEGWHKMGLLAWTPDPGRLPGLVDPYDENADLDRRARSYLQVNCAHCHQLNAGGAATIELEYELPLEKTKTVSVRPIQGTFNISGASIIAPGDPAGSVLYYRVSKLGAGRMPRIGSNQVDERATRMLHDWIAKMPPRSPEGIASRPAKVALEDRDALASLRGADRLSASERAAAVGRLASSTRGALMLLGFIDKGEASKALLREVAATTRNSPLGEVRDLFERFIPVEERVTRIGDTVDRTAILALNGDNARGRQIFSTNAGAQCKNCHKAGDVGESVGPDLSKIGAKYNKVALLDQIVEPSKTIEPAYITHLLETKDGRVFSGLLVERTSDAVVLKDAQAKTIKVLNGEIDHFVPQLRSLMPELLLHELTAQQAADLLEFLASLR